VTETVQSRRTGIVLVALLAGFAGLSLWRGHPQRAALWAGASVAATILVLAAPRAWLAVWRVWMRIALAISAVLTVVILGVCYYMLFMPVGLVMRAAGRDALRISWRHRQDSYWVGREPVEPSLERYRRQF
jgi:hypothetical protein